MLQVKGSVPLSIRNYVQKEFPDRYHVWFNKLPQASKELYSGAIPASQWLDSETAAAIPTKMVGELFYHGDFRMAAWLTGRFSAEVALTGIYKMFVMIASPKFIIDRASMIMTTFYSPTALTVVESRPHGVTLHLTQLPGASPVIENRIAGWMEKALEICGCKELDVQITRALSSADKLTEYTVAWKA